MRATRREAPWGSVESGSDRDPLARRGLVGLVARTLLEGTRTRSAFDIASERDRLGARLSAWSGAETSEVSVNALRETLPDALALLADVLLHPAFAPADVERARGLRLTSLAAKKGDPGALAQDRLSRLLWGDRHPWGLPSGGTPETVKAITVADLARYHATY